MNYYNGRLPLEALAHRSWPPIQKKMRVRIRPCKVSSPHGGGMVSILAVARPCLATSAVAELYSVISSKLLGILLMGLMVQMLGWSGAV